MPLKLSVNADVNKIKNLYLFILCVTFSFFMSQGYGCLFFFIVCFGHGSTCLSYAGIQADLKRPVLFSFTLNFHTDSSVSSSAQTS